WASSTWPRCNAPRRGELAKTRQGNEAASLLIFAIQRHPFKPDGHRWTARVKMNVMKTWVILTAIGSVALAAKTALTDNTAHGWLMFIGSAAVAWVLILAGYGIAYLTEKKAQEKTVENPGSK